MLSKSVSSVKSVDCLVTDNLDSIIDAPDGIKRLRELILQLAVTGGLTGPANRFPETGKSHVKDYVKFLNGYAFKSKWFQSEGIRLVRNTNVSHGWLNWKNAACIAEDRKSEFERFALEEGDIVLSLDRPLIATGLKVAKIKKRDLPCLLLQRVAKAEFTSNELLPDFFLCWLLSSSFIDSIDPGRSKGVPHISTRQTEALPFRPPPLAEQKQIVAKVNELMAWCDKLDALKQKRDTLQRASLKATLRDLVGKAVPAVRTHAMPTEPSPPNGALGQHALPLTRLGPIFTALIRDPADVKQLRDAILQLAVQGRLVPQHKEDGTAADLLTQIEKAKRKDAEERKARGERIRKAKVLPPIKKAEIPFDIPKGWTWVRLGEYGDWGAGSTPNRKSPEYYNGSFSWFKSGELNDKRDLKGSVETVTEKALAECSLRQNKIGDVLIAMYGATIGKLAILGEEGTTNQAVCACTCNDGISNVFLFNLLMAWRFRFSEQGAGGAQPNISRIKIVNTVVPLPPLAEQQRIVKKVDELMAWCDELEILLQAQSTTATRFAAAIAQT